MAAHGAASNLGKCVPITWLTLGCQNPKKQCVLNTPVSWLGLACVVSSAVGALQAKA
jgi:hypothetical protein